MSKPIYPHLRVDPEFKRKIKREAAALDLSILQYTKRLAIGEEEPINRNKKRSLWNKII